MKAITIPEFGGPDALVLAEVDTPAPRAGEVLVEWPRPGSTGPTSSSARATTRRRPARRRTRAGVSGHGRGARRGRRRAGRSATRCARCSPGGGYAEQVAVPAGQLLPVPDGRRRSSTPAALPEVVVHGVVQRLHDRPPAARRDAARPRRRRGHRHDGDPAGPRASARGSRSRRVGGEARGLPRARRGDPRQLPRAGLRRGGARGHRRARAPTSSSTTWARKYLARNVDALAANGRLVIIGLQGGTQGRARPRGAAAKRAAVIATSLRARPLREKAAIVAAVREHVWPLVASGRVRPVVHSRHPLADAAGGPPRAGGQRATSARCC